MNKNNTNNNTETAMTNTINETSISNATANVTLMTLDEAIKLRLDEIRQNANNDSLFAKWIWGQVNIPYHRLSNLALDQRGRVILSVKKRTGIEGLNEVLFEPALKRVVYDFFAENPILKYEAEYYFSL